MLFFVKNFHLHFKYAYEEWVRESNIAKNSIEYKHLLTTSWERRMYTLCSKKNEAGKIEFRKIKIQIVRFYRVECFHKFGPSRYLSYIRHGHILRYASRYAYTGL